MSIVLAARPCGSNEDCQKNYEFISKRRERDDYSVHKDSYYMFVSDKTFDDLVTLKGLEYSGTAPEAKEIVPDRPEINQLVHDGFSDEQNKVLEDSLSSSLGTEDDIVYTRRNNYFVVYGIVDLINFEYSKAHPSQAPWFFSTQEIIDNLPEDDLDDITEVTAFIDQNGLCLEEEYKTGSCSMRYQIESFDKINEFTNQAIYEELKKKAIYVQVGLDPKYFQHHEPGCEHAVHAGFGRPTYAGVLTGINLPSCRWGYDYYSYGTYYGESDCYNWSPDGSEYWKMYIRRHGNGYNYVRLNCTFMKRLSKTSDEWVWNTPFAGMSSKMYTVQIPKDLPTSLEIPYEPNTIYNNDELVDLIQAAIDNAISNPGSVVDTSTIVIETQYLDCMNNQYNLTSINGISNLIIDNPLCIIDTTGTITYGSVGGRRLQEATTTEVTKLNYLNLNVKGISFGSNLFQNQLFHIRIENNPSLKSIAVGENSMSLTQYLSIGNNPSLLTLSIGRNSFSFQSLDQFNLFKEAEFAMFDLPNMKKIEFQDDSMKNFATVTVADVDEEIDELELVDGKAFNSMQQYKADGYVHPDIDNYFSSINSVAYETVEFEKSVYSVCSTCELIDISPLSVTASGWNISPEPMEGLTFDPETGRLYGTTLFAPASVEYSVSATVDGKVYFGSFTLEVNICTGVTLELFADTSFVMSWDVYQSSSETAIISGTYDAKKLETLTYNYCLQPDIYTIHFVSGKGEYGRDQSGYALSVDNGEMKFDVNQFYGNGYVTAEHTTRFSLYLPFQMQFTKWNVYKTGYVASNWNAVDFDASEWESALPVDFGASDAITTYIRKEFELDESYSVLNVRVKYQGGLVAYFNGNKVARFNLNESFDSETRGTTLFDDAKYSKFHIILSEEGLIKGTNVIAFEIHTAEGQDLSSPVVFDATGVLTIDDCSIVVDSVTGITGAEFSGNSNQYTLNSLDDLFNLQPNGFTLFAKSGMYLEWAVENLEGSKFNSFALSTVNNNQAWKFSLLGRENEAEEYSAIYDNGEIVAKYRERVAVDTPNGMTSYRQFKYQVNETNVNSKVNEVIFQYCRATSEQ